MTVNTTDVRKGSEWLSDWDPEDEASWNSALAWRTLVITTFALTLAFSTWFLASAIAPTLTNLGFELDKSQLYWLTAMPGLAGGTMRLIWMWLPPVMGTRKLVTLTTALLLIPLVGWGMAVQNPSTTSLVPSCRPAVQVPFGEEIPARVRENSSHARWQEEAADLSRCRCRRSQPARRPLYRDHRPVPAAPGSFGVHGGRREGALLVE